MSADSNPLDFSESKTVYFNCHMCGECCSSWNIPVEAEKAERLLEKHWVQARLQETNRQLTRMTPETYRIPLTDENVCVFLAEDKRCLVEAHEGLTLKPHECQRFPFATVRLPDGTDWHETSAACKFISEKLLLAFQPIQPKPAPAVAERNSGSSPSDPLTAQELAEADLSLSAELEPVALFPERIPVAGFRAMGQAQYHAYQQNLRKIFTTPDIDPESALFEAHYLLKTLTAGKEADWALESRPNRLKRFCPAMAGLLTTVFLRKPYRTMSWVSLLLGREYPDPRLFGMPVDLSQQRKIGWDHSPQAQLNLRLNAFLFNLLQRRRLVALGSSLSAHLAMAGVACLLVQWYARTIAWMQGSGVPSEQDLSLSIRLVERYYTGHQPRFLAFFTSRWRGDLVAALLFGV